MNHGTRGEEIDRGSEIMTGKDVRTIRLDLSMSQRDLGDVLGVTDKTVSTWETSPHVSRLAALAITLLVLAEAKPGVMTSVKAALAFYQGIKKARRNRREARRP